MSFKLMSRSEHGIYAVGFRSGEPGPARRLPEGVVVEPMDDDREGEGDPIPWGRPTALRLRPSRVSLKRLGLVRLDGGEPVAAFNCAAYPVRHIPPGRPEGSLHDGIPAEDYVQPFGYPGRVDATARVRLYIHPDRPTVALVSDREQSTWSLSDMIPVLANRVAARLGLGTGDVVWIEHSVGGLVPCRGGHTPAESFDCLEFGHGWSRAKKPREAVERLVGHYL
jgi:hypothetical protein